jgi:hypothetical protein
METLGYFFSSLLNMIGFTSEPSTDTLKTSDNEDNEDNEENEENKEETNKEETNKKDESKETFVFIDIFDDKVDNIDKNAHDIFTTSF